LNWNWDTASWTRAPKVLLGVATIWPMVYMALFFVGILSMFLLMPFEQERSRRTCGDLDLLQLDRKIKNGELKQLTVRREEIMAMDRDGKCEYHIYVSNESTREEILRETRELDANGVPRVAKIEENTSERPPAPAVSAIFSFGFFGFFVLHLLTILLTVLLMPFYIILAVKNERLDQTMRIIWVVLLCTLGLLANPVYWFLYVWRKPGSNEPLKGAGLNPGETI
jgi:hypothetical protein